MNPTLLSLRLSHKKRTQPRRPWSCPYCGSTIFHRWGKVAKPAWNRERKKLVGYRYRCNDCGRTFRAYPEAGSEPYTARDILRLAVLTWTIGLSLTSVVNLYKKFGTPMSRSTVWRASKDLLGESPFPGLPLTVTVADPEEGQVSDPGIWVDMSVLIDIGVHQKVELHLATDRSVRELQTWLQRLAKELDLEVVYQG